jgi:hypothetical protein
MHKHIEVNSPDNPAVVVLPIALGLSAQVDPFHLGLLTLDAVKIGELRNLQAVRASK